MTEMEIVFIFTLVYKNIYGYAPDIQSNGIFSDSDDNIGLKCTDRLDNSELGFTIERERGAEYSTNGNYSIVNQFEIVKELLKRGFDLFGLIESDQAIDKTKYDDNSKA